MGGRKIMGISRLWKKKKHQIASSLTAAEQGGNQIFTALPLPPQRGNFISPLTYHYFP